ncbi:hypothetical protein [Nocardia sp. NPDC004722]
MHSLEQRFIDFADRLNRLGCHAVADRENALREELTLLNDERRRPVMSDDWRDRVTELSGQAEAVLERQIHAALHPTILSPRPIDVEDDLEDEWDTLDESEQ